MTSTNTSSRFLTNENLSKIMGGTGFAPPRKWQWNSPTNWLLPYPKRKPWLIS